MKKEYAERKAGAFRRRRAVAERRVVVDAEPEKKPEVAVKIKPENVEPKTETKVEVKVEPKTDPKPAPEVKVEVKADPEPESKVKVEVKADPKPAPKVKVDLESDLEEPVLRSVYRYHDRGVEFYTDDVWLARQLDPKWAKVYVWANSRGVIREIDPKKDDIPSLFRVKVAN